MLTHKADVSKYKLVELLLGNTELLHAVFTNLHFLQIESRRYFREYILCQLINDFLR